ncbi:hypothetical protein NSE01_26150 [Novosphingobium sediminis]|uniref:Outer membrane assembly lipoprotein YfiO n=1 Tax=Novosphingobium sediminis TaxID=707214 RepID=A0A512AM39_9SPHN|nr:hypothetical protein [Novosphingobium sediminis]GEO00783.1 hypothetical protein NSE01_26150 [Novosphingobium sediminis]
MRLKRAKGVVMAGLLASSGAALACADVGCDPTWSLFGGAQACHNRVVIAPGNDSRVNLLALLRDSAGLGLTGAVAGGGDYPKTEYDETGFGHTFLDWGMVTRAWVPAFDPAAEPPVDAIDGPCGAFRAATPQFADALAANRTLPQAERTALTAARAQLVARCADPKLPAVLPGVAASSAPGKAFLGYLAASDAFYASHYGEAAQGYAGLVGAADPWVAETARYMVARAWLGEALVHSMDEYGFFGGLKAVDKAAAQRGKAALADYLKAYPKGRYADSARGLERRAMWLSGDFAALGERYESVLAAAPKEGEALVDLINETDGKYLSTSDNPNPRGGGLLLLAAADLMAMRVANPDDRYDMGVAGSPLDADVLASQQASFLRAPQLYSFLQANHAFYVAKDYARVLQLIPDDAKRASYTPLAFSRQVLRGQALAAKGDPNEAGFWLELLGGAKALWQRPTVELALAMNWERHGKLAQVFAAGSPITDRMVRDILLTHSAGPALLRRAALDVANPQEQRDTALFTLLYKQLSRGDYAGFRSNQSLARTDAPTDGLWGFGPGTIAPLGVFAKGRTGDGGFACPALIATAATLAANPQDVHARLCLGEFWRLNGFDGFTALDTAPPKGQLGGAANDYPGKPLARGAIYASVISDPRSAPDDRAYALYRAVNCYGPSGYNSCGGEDVPIAARKGWYDRLRREFPKSRWAKKLKYYW